MNEVIIKVENLGYTYTDNYDDDIVKTDTMPALEGINLEIRRG